ncbi:glycosyltransferase [Tychonema sp. BBK16]|uniref:glycosyltransferase n=1 Tax=Tychonema sp. BBK16 TaxID=2699888 RepID=UPI001F40F0EC|nr:glycosyltransferase [Tychonema sp. BBK16]MCF6374252.1 glycosyltransferase [Tychonema sp. BBK16]
MLKKVLNSSFGINFVGHVSGEYGLGEAARGVLRGMESAGIPFTLNDIKVDWHRNLDDTYTDFSEQCPYPINLVFINPGDGMIESLGAGYFEGRYNIGYWSWELPILPRVWQYAFDLFDEVWTLSNYTAEAISRASTIPVVKIAPSIYFPPTSLKRKHLGLPESKFIFLFIFDLHSTLERKNPLAIIEAFQQAFGKSNKDVSLIIKFSNGEFHPQEREQLLKQAEGYSSISFIEGHLKKEEIHALVNNCDCYVSLHRAEGFGLTMAEAMYYGKPVIATGYSANMEFMNVGNSFPVKYRLVTSPENNGPYPQGSIWADPDIEHAASLMQYVFQNCNEAQKVGTRAIQEVKSILSPQDVGSKIRSRLEYIMKIRMMRELGGNEIQLPLFQDESFLQETDSLNNSGFLDAAYRAYLKREADRDGKQNYLQAFDDGKITRQQLLDAIRNSSEFESVWKLVAKELLPSATGVEIISVHVPKTGGTAFGEILQQVYGTDRVFCDLNSAGLETILKQGSITLETKAINGLFPAVRYGECLLYSLPPKLIVWLRHPIMRLISSYCYSLSIDSDADKNKLQTYVSYSYTKQELLEFAKMPETQNLMSSCVQGMKLSDFYFIGLQEFFQDDLNDLRELLRWPEVENRWYNKNKYPGYHAYVNNVLADKNLVAQLAALNSEDIELYETALKLREQRKDGTRMLSVID